MKKSALNLRINPFRIAADSTGETQNIVAIANRTLKLKKNENDFTGLSFNISKDIVKVQVQTSSGIYPVVFGSKRMDCGQHCFKRTRINCKSS